MGLAFLSDLDRRRRPRVHRHIGGVGDIAASCFYVFVVIFLVLPYPRLTIFSV